VKFVSTRPPHGEVSLRTAVLEDPAPHGALYQPVGLPRLTLEELRSFEALPFAKLAEELAVRVFRETLDEQVVRRMAAAAFDFPLPLAQLDPNTWILELFHGPTGSFKDFGARFLAQLLSALRGPSDRPVAILVATSGDTGGAVANAVHGIKGVSAVVLFPRDRLSGVQLRQIQEPGTWSPGPGQGVTPVEVEGTFDDCQRMVKEVLASPGPRVRVSLTSANSVNVGRLIPQAFYYIYAWNALPPEAREGLVVSVPSGNLGNLTAGILAEEMGVPFRTFVAASNANAAMRRFLDTGALSSDPSLQTVSSAMDVSRPSNLERLLVACGRDVSVLRSRVHATRHEDAEVVEVMGRVARDYRYLMDPHTAVGYLGLEAVRRELGAGTGLVLSTADPAKFPETVVRATGHPPPGRPEWETAQPMWGVERRRSVEEATVRMGTDPEELRGLLASWVP
jgi:threonine synthase